LRDLQTNRNALSVYRLVDPAAELLRVAAALALESGHVETFDYVLLDWARVEALGLKERVTPATTADGYVNAAHLDFVELRAADVVALAECIAQHAALERLQPKSVGDSICESLKLGRFARNVLPVDVESKLVQWGKLA
jgi:hypothetical protein